MYVINMIIIKYLILWNNIKEENNEINNEEINVKIIIK